MNRRQWMMGVLVTALALVQSAWAGAEPVLRVGSNLLRNATFEEAGERGVPAGWTLSGAVAQAAAVRDPDNPRARLLKITTRGEGVVTLQQAVDLSGPADLLASVRVRGDGRLVMRAGKLSMSYHDQGHAQRVVGMFRQDQAGSVTLSITMSSLDGRPAVFYLADARLQAATVADAAPRRTAASSDTALVSNGQPRAAIVIPDDDESRVLAERINAVVTRLTGVALPVVTDEQATRTPTPALTPDAAGQHLILVGRLGVNRAIWPAYNRFLAAADGYYPGGDGYVVRTCVNVVHGNNHLVLGGSSDAGVRRAVDQFIAHLERAPADRGALSVPWLLDVELGGDCLAAMRARDALWSSDPNSSELPPVQSGYGTVRRWYENAMSYYWTGWPSYRRRVIEMTDELIADNADTHHYLLEFFVNAYDMVDDTDLLSEPQRRGLDRLILKDFLHMTTGPDVSWMTAFSPPYDRIGLTNRHAIAPWAADLRAAEFLLDGFELTGDLAELVSFREREKRAFMRHWLAHRWAVSMPGSLSTEHEEEIPAAMFRYALRHDLYDFFESGRAVRALSLEKINHLTGTNVRPGGVIDHALILGILANYDRDGRYRALRDTLPNPMREPFQGRYVAGIHRYAPGPELEAADAQSLAGVSEPSMDDHRRRHLDELASHTFAKPTVPPAEVFDFATFRGGFTPDDDFLLVNGIASYALPGAILNLSARGHCWFDGAPFGADASVYFNNNAVHVLRTDRWLDGSPPYAAAARRDWLVQWDDGGAVAFTLDPFVGMRWQRQVIRAAPGLFVVRDTLTAAEDGTYQVSVNWFPTYAAEWDGRSLISAAGRARFHVTPLGGAFRVAHETSPQAVLRQMTQRAMKRGDSLVAVTVLEARTEGEAARVPVLTPDGRTLVLDGQGGTAATIALSWNPDANVEVRMFRGKDQYQIARGEVLATTTPDGVLEQLIRDTHALFDRGASSADDHDPPAPANAATLWRTHWENDALRAPARVYPQRHLPGGVADFGRTIALHEVRAYQAGGPWSPATLPADILVSAGEADGGAPGKESATWRRLDPPTWRAGARTGNYGESTPVEQFKQVVDAGGIPVRYLRAERLTGLAFYDRAASADHRRYRIKPADLNGDGDAELLVYPEIWPKFVRRGQLEDDAFAVLNADGSLRYQHTARTNYQAIRALDYLDRGHPQVVTAAIDGRIEVFDGDGRLVRDLDLYQAHVEYDRQYGRGNTRQPAGGFIMPYDVGLWRIKPQDPPGLLVSRYGWFSFIDHRGAFDGLLTAGSYVMPLMLDQPRDFDGDGNLEQLCLSYGRLWRVTGPRDERVPEPAGYYYYPQAYRTRGVAEPASITTSVDGPRPIALQPLARGDEVRHVFVARSNYLAIYDARAQQWAFDWQPLVEITAAAVVRCDAGALRVLAFTRDRLLWSLSWDGDWSKLGHYQADSLADDINAIAPTAAGGAVLCGNAGLYLQSPDGRRTRIAEGAFTDAVEFGDGIAAVTNDARVLFYRSDKGEAR